MELNSGQQYKDWPYVGRRKLINNINKTEHEDRDISGQIGTEMRV